MHPGAVETMQKMLRRYTGDGDDVLDVGSMDINGTYRPLVESLGWQYTGLDLAPGKNVDIVSTAPYDFPMASDQFDIVMSGSTMEHVEAPWIWLRELVRVLRPGGLLCILTHWSFPLHRYPIDTYRYMPDGLQYLFDISGPLYDEEIAIVNKTDIVGSAFKR